MTNCLQQRFAPAGASLSVAYKIARSIAFDHPCIISLQKELFFCYKIAKIYDEFWHSIIWMRSSTPTKKRLAATLNRFEKFQRVEVLRTDGK
jgi:TnpA family transposase